MDSTHRKIELQSPADLSYLISNTSLAARQRLDTHFPPSSNPNASASANGTGATNGGSGKEEFDLRKRVEELVQAYIDEVYKGVKGNVSINGLEGRELEGLGETEEIEAFDHKLASRVQAASATIEDLTLSLANLRRTAPAEAARGFEMATETQSRAWEERFREAEGRTMREAKETELDVGGLDRVAEMEETWERGLGSLVTAKSGIGGTVARLERAKEVVGYLEGTK